MDLALALKAHALARRMRECEARVVRVRFTELCFKREAACFSAPAACEVGVSVGVVRRPSSISLLFFLLGFFLMTVQCALEDEFDIGP